MSSVPKNPGDQQLPTQSLLKSPLLYSSAALCIALLVIGWIFFSRWEQNRYIDRKSREETRQKQLQDDRIALEQFGGKELAIQSFYASPGAIGRGETVQLCYGVANAKTVTLEPQPNEVWPSYARCVTVSPAKTTTYTLTVTDVSGNTKTQSLQVQVR